MTEVRTEISTAGSDEKKAAPLPENSTDMKLRYKVDRGGALKCSYSIKSCQIKNVVCDIFKWKKCFKVYFWREIENILKIWYANFELL